METYVATYNSSEFGQEVRLYASLEAAEKWRQEIAAEWFDTMWPELEKPADPAALADTYFNAFNNPGVLTEYESFSCECQEIRE